MDIPSDWLRSFGVLARLGWSPESILSLTPDDLRLWGEALKASQK